MRGVYSQQEDAKVKDVHILYETRYQLECPRTIFITFHSDSWTIRHNTTVYVLKSRKTRYQRE
jgi:hypothetical protein